MTEFDQVLQRQQTGSSKWDKYAGEDVLPMWVADMDFASPPAVVDAIRQRADHGVFGYNVPPPGLLELVVARLQEHYRWEVSPESVLFSPGVVPAINQFCRGLVRPGDAVVTTVPIYHPFLAAPGHFGHELVRLEWQEASDGWQYPLDDLARLLKARDDIGALFLCHPHNPLGQHLDETLLSAIVALCERHNVLILSDEIHCDLLLDGRRHVPTATLPGATALTVTTMAASKTFNVAGLGGSITVIDDAQLRERFVAAGEGIMANVTTFAYTAMLAAWRDGEPWRQQLLAYLEANRDYLAARIEAIEGLRMSPVQATYLAWLDCRALQVADLETFFVAAGVGMSPGSQFGRDGFMRLNFGCPRATLMEACDRIARAVAGKQT